MVSGTDVIKIGPFGNASGQDWDGKGHSNIVQIFVSHNEMINLIQYQYVANGKLMLSKVHGSSQHGFKFDVVKLNYPKEHITWIKGYTNCNNGTLSSITFGTNLSEYGPFGTFEAGKEKEFSIKLGENHQFFGFHGNSSKTSVCSSIGVYMKPCSSIGVYMEPNMTLGSVKRSWKARVLWGFLAFFIVVFICEQAKLGKAI